MRIFDNQDFAYIKLTVERPLRLNFQCSAERLARVKAAGAFVALAESKKRKDQAGIEADIAAGKKEQAAIVKVLETLAAKHGQTLYKRPRRVFQTAGCFVQESSQQTAHRPAQSHRQRLGRA